MHDYMLSCQEKLTSKILNQPPNPETKPITNPRRINITDPFREILMSTYDSALFGKKSGRTEKTKGLIKRTEERMNELYEKSYYNIAKSRKITEVTFNNLTSLATSYCNMGIVYNNSTSKNKLLVRQKHLKRSLELLNRKELDRRTILIVMRVSLQLEQLFYKLNEPEKCYPFSHKALDLYHEYTKCGDDFPAPIDALAASLEIEDEKNRSFNIEKKPNSKISLVILYAEMLKHVETMFNSDIIKCHLPALEHATHNFLMYKSSTAMADLLHEAVTWASAAGDLFRYLIHQYRFNESRDCLAAAQYMLDIYEKELCETAKANNVSVECPGLLYHNLRGYQALGWGHYAIRLFQYSKYDFLFNTNIKTHKAELSLKSTCSKSKESVNPLIFTHLRENLEYIIKEITVTYVSNIDDATGLFGHCINSFATAKAYFAEDKSDAEATISRNINVAFNLFLAYKYLAWFEPDKDQKMKLYTMQLHIFRTNYIDSIISADVSYYRTETYLEIMVSYSIMLDIIMEKGEDIEKPFMQIMNEVKTYIPSIITCIEYLLSYYLCNRHTTN